MDLFSFLIVDDEKEFVEALTLRLGERGYTADFAFTGWHEDDSKKLNKGSSY